ncbi:hypothetical protein ACJJTC_017863 [Scirpophaga incertulas]
MPMSVVTKIHEWDCEELPPRLIVSEEDEDESDTFSSYSGRPQRTPQNSRPSMLAMPSKSGKGKGVEMDMATKLANEMFQKGKEALEMAANMKKESKVAAIVSADAELVRIERAHNKALAEMTTKLTAALDSQNDRNKETTKQDIKSGGCSRESRAEFEQDARWKAGYPLRFANLALHAPATAPHSGYVRAPGACNGARSVLSVPIGGGF